MRYLGLPKGKTYLSMANIAEGNVLKKVKAAFTDHDLFPKETLIDEDNRNK